ncbi:MAG: hypothetical protein ACPGQM_13230 [Alphaproteobacteria bacterium]
MSVFKEPAFDEYENVMAGFDRETGLREIIAIRNTNLGPGVGGCRMWPSRIRLPHSKTRCDCRVA